MKRKAWYVPLKKVNNDYVIPENLFSIKPAFCDIESNEFEGTKEEDLLIKEGQPFKVELVSFFIGNNYDGNNSNNDLLIKTQTKYGFNLRTNAVNFFQKNILLNHVKLPDIDASNKDLLSVPYIYGVNIHNPLNRLHIEIEIQEIDRNTVSDDKFIEASKTFVSDLGGFFPNLLKYTNTFSQGIGIFEQIDDIFKLIDPNPNKTVFRESLDLYRLGLGETPLRQGIYILFSGTRHAPFEPLHDNSGAHGAMYTWKDNGISSIDDNEPIWDHVAIRIVPCRREELMSNDLLINQDVSTLIAPLWSSGHQDIEQMREKVTKLRTIIDDVNKMELLKNLKVLYDRIANEKPIDMLSLVDRFAENLIEKAKTEIPQYIPEEWMSLLEKLSQVKKLREMYKMIVEKPADPLERIRHDEIMKNFPNDIQKQFIRETIDTLSEFIPDEEIELLKREARIINS